jgi:hypothetical protein
MLALLCLALPVASGCSDLVQGVASPHVLIARPASAPPQRLRLSGTAERVEHRTSRAGHPYDIIFICDNECIRVYLPLRTQVANGNHVSALGTFFSARTVERRTFHHEMDADEVLIER